ncbi:MAG: hypothetical protein SYNGOMJ08_00347 [Candidatus Syntrophoarchaeum sp. GoM_oil]|nr:MAG: hypothetical protein SYNGOMJ08_00347 [Candidatus Syntrophoarchaeum sp. GoM_oil]
MHALKKDGKIKTPISLIIDPFVIYWENTKYSDVNATSNAASVGSDLTHFKAIHFDKAMKSYKPHEDEDKHFFQAEVLVEEHIPIRYIKEPVKINI